MQQIWGRKGPKGAGLTSEAHSDPPAVPDLRVSLEGDLTGGTLALEAFWHGLRDDWRMIALAPAALAGTPGTAARILARARPPAAEALPLASHVIARMQAARAEGRRVVLTATGPREFAEAVAARLDCVDAVEIVGTAQPAMPPTSPPPAGPGAGAARLATVLRAMRPHQWVKNLLVFLPMIASHGIGPANAGRTLLAFVSFCLVASAVYVLNDLLDLRADRRHPTKRHRPFASGALPLSVARWLLPGLLGAGLALAALGGPALLGVMLVYAAATSAYSLKIKGTLGADVIFLALLYTLRIVAGAAVTGIPLSMWLLSFSVFLFLSLAAVKRLSELVCLENDGGNGRASGRAYRVEDRPVMAMIATSAGFLSVLVLALYIDSPEVTALYANPQILWGLGIGLLYWISRTVLFAHRGAMDQDPVVFALTDRISRYTALAFGLIFIAAILG